MKSYRQILVLCLTFIITISSLIGLVPAAQAEEASSDSVSILACSDFQSPEGNRSGHTNVSSILNAMKKDGITNADGFFCCGDYDYEYTDTQGGIDMLKKTVKNFVSSNYVFVQGNHDSAIGTNGLSYSGNNDPVHGKYGVFAINEDDYMWYNSDETTVKHTTQNLIDYLNEKLAEGYDKPIFILSHLGLHYSMRTYYDGDGKYAHYIFNALNEAAQKGLNIVYLYGHNHSNGWDDYLGGAAVYLAKGDSILIAQGTNTSKKSETLAFTYMNAGYTGYYSDVNGQDNALTMTYFTVSDKDITAVRYDKDGKHDLKSAGVTNAYKGENNYSPDTTVYTSPQTIQLTSVSDQTPIDNILNIDKSLPIYRKVMSLDEIKDGGKYLMILRDNASIMIPSEVTKSGSSGYRTGFDLESTPVFGDGLAYADCIGKEWTFEKSGNAWLVGDGESYVSYEDMSASGSGIAARLTSSGSPMTIEGEGVFTFSTGDYCFNYNSRGLVNFYASGPAAFCLYEAVGYGVVVVNGNAMSDGVSVTYAKEGDTLTLKASDVPQGYVFDRWVVTMGNITLQDSTQTTVTLTMPSEAITLKATYKPISTDTDAPDSTDESTSVDTSASSESSTLQDTTAPEADEATAAPNGETTAAGEDTAVAVSGGCKAVMGYMSVTALVAVVGAATLLLKKKED